MVKSRYSTLDLTATIAELQRCERNGSLLASAGRFSDRCCLLTLFVFKTDSRACVSPTFTMSIRRLICSRYDLKHALCQNFGGRCHFACATRSHCSMLIIHGRTQLAKGENKAMLLVESGVRIHATDYAWPKSNMPSAFSMKVSIEIRHIALSPRIVRRYDVTMHAVFIAVIKPWHRAVIRSQMRKHIRTRRIEAIRQLGVCTVVA